ncbi:response regulator [Chlorogloea sp. CCALA 695]|uniref:response regulator n=1 Tax=Chlorogloea sp. CCALA 695 TaxID=2107693 RepID=UPI000D07D342|nr:response regulator [Chlorogloea sp. CCALA 695]PSB33790.1 response regulator [Chlorogloea sp. CCALA 695]
MAETVEPQSKPTTTATRSISVAKALQDIGQKKLSGQLTIRDPNSDSLFWRVYVGSGHIHFATSAIGQQERLAYLLQHYPRLESFDSNKFSSDYQYLCHCWQSGQLSLKEVRQLLFLCSQEALLQSLSLPNVQLGFNKKIGLDPLLLSVSLPQIIAPLQNPLNQWKQIQAEINSPYSRPYIKDLEQFAQAVYQIKTGKPQQLDLLTQTLGKNLCFYEVAQQLKMDVLKLANFVHSFMRTDIMGVNPYRSVQNDTRPVVACIDDSKTVQRNVKLILESAGYRVLELMEPARVLTMLVRDKPNLVLMDISMPDIDGYELCRMLRLSSALKEVPIVMLTGRDGLVDRIRARMVGATNYITKPFQPEQLLNTVSELINSSSIGINQ